MTKYKVEDWVGKKINQLQILQPDNNDKAKVICECDCGIIKSQKLYYIILGRTKSCGCYARKLFLKSSTKHNMTNTRLHNIWSGIKHRCSPTSKHHKYYYDRGIHLHKPWAENFLTFYNEACGSYSEGLSIDRIDNDKGYIPGNVRWVNGYVQSNNTRKNKFVYYKNNKYTYAEICRTFNLKYHQFRRLIIKGMSVEYAINNSLRS